MAAVAPAAADDALEAMLLAAAVALEATDPVAVNRLAASLAMLDCKEEILEEMEDCAEAGAEAA